MLAIQSGIAKYHCLYAQGAVASQTPGVFFYSPGSFGCTVNLTLRTCVSGVGSLINLAVHLESNDNRFMPIFILKGVVREARESAHDSFYLCVASNRTLLPRRYMDSI